MTEQAPMEDVIIDGVTYRRPVYREYPAKSAKLELIRILKEQMYAAYQPIDRASITRAVLDRAVSDLEHAVLLLDTLQDVRNTISPRAG